MTVWQKISSDIHQDNASPDVERAEFGRSVVDLYPLRSPEGKWKFIVDGDIAMIVDDRAEVVRKAEIEAWNSPANTMFARGVRHND